MRIAYLTPTYPPYPGGIGMTAYYTAREMARRGHGVHVFTPRYNSRQVVSHISNSVYPVVHYLRPIAQYGLAGVLPQLLWQLKGFDIVHCYYPFFGGLEIAAFRRMWQSFQLVVHHEMDIEGQGWQKKVFSFHTKYILPWILRHTDHLFVLSEDYFEHSDFYSLWKRYGRGRWSVAPNGVDTKRFSPFDQKSMGSPPIILYVGGLDRAHYFKGIPVLLSAVAALAKKNIPVRCQIVGKGDMVPLYKEEAKKLGIESSVEFLGLRTHQELPEVMRRADVFVMPSVGKTESFCLAAAEAMSCGVPAVVSDLPGLRSTIASGVTGFIFRKGDPEDLAKKLMAIISEPAVWESMRIASRTRMEQKFNWQRIGDDLEKVYREIGS